ncbi:MAG: YdcF family protein [Sphingomonadales bacterium]
MVLRFRRPTGWALFRARLPRILVVAVLIVCALWLGGFWYWCGTLAENPEAGDLRTDGIVVLTGGAHRIDEAVRLLAGERGHRLLISGVNQRIQDETLREVAGISRDLFECCVDLGRVAQNTQENAIETAAWARRNGYRTLRIVTTYDHMPRSLIEMRRAMPGVDLFAHPVSPATVNGVRPPVLRRLASEYSKYWVALLRARLSAPPPITGAPDLSRFD